MKRKNNCGVTLVELMITVSIILLGLLPLLRLFINATRGTQHMASITVAEGLIEQMFSEIEQKKWDENSVAPGIFLDLASATSSSNLGAAFDGEDTNDKKTFDDIDDYNGHIENPPKDLKNDNIPGYEEYRIDVEVKYVDVLTDGTPISDAAAPPSNFKKVTITVTWQSPSKERDSTEKRKSRIYYNGVNYAM